ncbi:MAG TPA: 6-bladed beta-propeller [Clostridiales bacterium]|nr:6-bladed beta-propeller [Clostridiales bacterium]HQP69211.1 6-bladed beta-propeller [Clostridiales bacterium]
MRFLKVLVFTVVLAVFFSCSKKVATYEQTIENGIRITKNTGVPADSAFKIELKEVGFIDMENETDSNRYISLIFNFDIDDDDNLYIMDMAKRGIHKYDENCSFVKAFGRMGNGPGEFEYPGTINVRGDSIFVPDMSTLQIIKYDTDGNFITNKRLDDITKFPRYPKKFGDKYISQSRDIYPDEEKGGLVMHEEISLYDRNFNFIRQLYENEYHEEGADANELSEKGLVTAFNDSLLYVSENSIDKYQVNIFDSQGTKIGEIRKNYRRIKDSAGEYANSVIGMQSDKYGRLWVSVYDDENPKKIIYDVFENDIFINRMNLDVGEGYFKYFVVDKIVAVNRENNNIKVYEY